MPRTARASQGNLCYHVLNRGNARAQVFRKDGDYEAFLRVVADAHLALPMPVLAYCLMPNHFHFVVRPAGDGDLGRWMQRVLTAHVRRYHRHYHSSGHVWQGRFKAFPIQEDEHLLTVLRYVERNPLRADLVPQAELWRWSSLRYWGSELRPTFLADGPVSRSPGWVAWVNEALTAAELEAVRRSVDRGAPFGGASWVEVAAAQLGLEASLRPRGRPRKVRDNVECTIL